ncbi:Hypothetical protein D9617_1g080630 [Elsinoe fawcettii]|nr:Hypothetical protein D9617_1g080630 [Elsinoe fawcettii]
MAPHADSPTHSTSSPLPSPYHAKRLDSSTLPPLHVNDGLLSPSDVSFLRPSLPTEPLSTLRARYEADGYILLKHLLPRSDVLSCRASYFSYLSPTGITDPSTPYEAGIFNPSSSPSDFPGIGTSIPPASRSLPFVQLALKAHSEPFYAEDFCKHPALLSFVASFTGWGNRTLGFKRTLLRNNVPTQKAIGVHYDQIFLRHGTPDAITAWVPIGDVALDGGGLIYLENGHSLGKETEEAFFNQAKERGMSDEEAKYAFNQNMAASGLLDEGSGPAEYGRKAGRRWLVAEYEAGDVVLHNPFAVHASTVNHDKEGRIRVGTDIRFVDSEGEWDRRWGEDYFRFDDGL